MNYLTNYKEAKYNNLKTFYKGEWKYDFEIFGGGPIFSSENLLKAGLQIGKEYTLHYVNSLSRDNRLAVDHTILRGGVTKEILENFPNDTTMMITDYESSYDGTVNFILVKESISIYLTTKRDNIHSDINPFKGQFEISITDKGDEPYHDIHNWEDYEYITPKKLNKIEKNIKEISEGKENTSNKKTNFNEINNNYFPTTSAIFNLFTSIVGNNNVSSLDANVKVNKDTLNSIANAIVQQEGTLSSTIKPSEMASAIRNIKNDIIAFSNNILTLDLQNPSNMFTLSTLYAVQSSVESTYNAGDYNVSAFNKVIIFNCPDYHDDLINKYIEGTISGSLTIQSIPLNDAAFYGCSQIETITLIDCPSIGYNAFYSCDKLSNVYLQHYNLQNITSATTTISNTSITFHVPQSLYNDYLNAYYWSQCSLVAEG